ncbi:MAG: tetratricopeptide repeat protein [Actinobacteria bacterium]|nr:tetratricopeptide repeat protein [Actinomycetota bacterium]
MTQSFGFAEVGEQWDEEDGLEVLFELDPRAWAGQAAWEARLAEVWASLDDVADDDAEGEEAFRARVDAVVAERVADDGVAAFERGCAFDSTGHSDRAVPLYREALAAGLTGLRRRRAVVQLSSSLRNLHRSDEALALLLAEKDNGSDGLDDAVAAFLALALVDVGREREAVRVALTALAPHLPRYQRSLARYAQALVEPG